MCIALASFVCFVCHAAQGREGSRPPSVRHSHCQEIRGNCCALTSPTLVFDYLMLLKPCGLHCFFIFFESNSRFMPKEHTASLNCEPPFTSLCLTFTPLPFIFTPYLQSSDGTLRGLQISLKLCNVCAYQDRIFVVLFGNMPTNSTNTASGLSRSVFISAVLLLLVSFSRFFIFIMFLVLS